MSHKIVGVATEETGNNNRRTGTGSTKLGDNDSAQKKDRVPLNQEKTALQSAQMTTDENPFVGPGKVFATEEEQFDEYIELMEWATQVTPEELDRFYEAVKAVLDS
jgi:hypothetical protein